VEDEYARYLARFDASVPHKTEVGAYAKVKGRLVKKLSLDEFKEKWAEFQEVDLAYEKIVEHGDTINDVLVKLLRERSDELLVERKI
jgi:hypothetical protein